MTPAGRLRVLIYGDIGGSGGYLRYCRGLFGKGRVPNDLDCYLVATPALLERIGEVDPALNLVLDAAPGSPSRRARYTWHLWTYPRLVHRIRPDIEFYPSGQLRVHLRKAVTVATCHNLLLFDAQELARYRGPGERRAMEVYRASQAGSLRRASGVIFLSKHAEDVVASYLPGIRRRCVIAHGLEPAFLRPEPRSYDLNDPVTILYVSTVHYYKHQPAVVEAVQRLRAASGLNLRLRLVGDGSPGALSDLRAAIRSDKAEDWVDLLGNLPDDCLRDEYRSADLFVFASSSETFGITLLEAMAARLPIACSERTGLPALLRDGGVYFDPERPESIAGALAQLLGDSQRREKLGDLAYRLSLGYTWEKTAQQTFAFIRDVAGARRTSSAS